MEFSYRFVYDLIIPFRDIRSQFTPIQLIPSITFDRNNVFNRSLIVDIMGDDIEVPTIARRHYESIISDNLYTNNLHNVEKVVLPLYVNSQPKNLRTFNSIMRSFFCSTTFAERLLKVVTSRGEVYYGGCGLILDEYFSPLLMCGLKAKKAMISNTPSMRYYRAVCHISPKVFSEPNKLINKGIIKKLIPLYTSVDVDFPHYHIASNFDNRKVEIIVDDFSRFFITPIAPTSSMDINDALNECLVNNIEDILYLI